MDGMDPLLDLLSLKRRRQEKGRDLPYIREVVTCMGVIALCY